MTNLPNPDLEQAPTEVLEKQMVDFGLNASEFTLLSNDQYLEATSGDSENLRQSIATIVMTNSLYTLSYHRKPNGGHVALLSMKPVKANEKAAMENVPKNFTEYSRAHLAFLTRLSKGNLTSEGLPLLDQYSEVDIVFGMAGGSMMNVLLLNTMNNLTKNTPYFTQLEDACNLNMIRRIVIADAITSAITGRLSNNPLIIASDNRAKVMHMVDVTISPTPADDLLRKFISERKNFLKGRENKPTSQNLEP